VTTDALSVGTHSITASVTDSGGLTGSQQITVNITAAPNTAPTVTITAPADNSSFESGTSVAFTGTATDTEDGSLTASLVWTSSADGPLGSGGSVTTDTLSVGTHSITASVTDSGGLTASDQITLSVNDVVTITKAEWRERRQELRVTAVSSSQPNAVLTVVGFGQMVSRPDKCDFKVRPVPSPGTVTVTSSLGGSATATVVIKK
jgi:hypothetical protein